MQKIILVCLVVVLCMFIYQLQNGMDGINDDKIVIADIEQQTLVNESLIERNNKLETKVETLKGSVASLEAKARYELNMIKPGETLVVLPGNYSIKVPVKKNIGSVKNK